jgi:N-acetylglutamate synthase-like GNAT family acetyltransferase
MVDMPGMQNGTVKIRRGKRTDFPALMALVAPRAAIAAEGVQIRHWRRLAGDPSRDFYVAEQGGTIRGIVLVCYIRELHQPGWQAVLDIVAPPFTECGIGQALLDFAKERARKRGCQRLIYILSREESDSPASLSPFGFQRVGEVLSCGLS